MATQKRLADIVGVSAQAISQWASRSGIDIKSMTQAEAVRAYCHYIRETAALRGGAADGQVYDLATERAKTEVLKQQELELRIKERSRELIPAEQFLQALTPVMKAVRTNVLAIPSKVVQQFKALKGIDIEVDIVEDICHDALRACTETDVDSIVCGVIEATSGIDAAEEDDDD